MENSKFDYERKMWGVNEVDVKPIYLGATRLKYVLSALKGLPDDAKILEIGCGGGSFSRAIKRYFPKFSVVGSDISTKVLEAAGRIGGGVLYKRANVYKLPFKNNEFDAVISFDVWEHLGKPAKAFSEVNRVLKPGGILHFFVPTEGNKLTLYQMLPKILYEFKKKYTGHVQTYDVDRLMTLLAESNFEVSDVKNSSYYLYQLFDLGYFSFLGFRGKNVAISVEGYLQFSKSSIFDKLLGSITKMFGVITFYENELFKFLPGGGVHITAVKLGKYF